MSYLPMAHIFERTLIIAFMIVGGKVCFWSRAVETIKQDLADIRPTCFVSVPRLYNKFYAKMKEKLDE